MKLKELDLKPEQRILICTEHGANFIYIGTAGEADFETLNTKLYGRIRDRMQDAVRNFDRRKSQTVMTFDNVFEEFRFWEPVEEREVVEQYPGEFEYDSLVIKITGNDGWIQYNPKVKPLEPETMDSEGAARLVEAIYKGVCQELVHAYQAGAPDTIRRCEREIRMNRYGMFEDPDGILRGCRKQAGL